MNIPPALNQITADLSHVGERVLGWVSYLVSGLLTVLGLNAQEWYWIVGAGCAVVTTWALVKYKRLHYELRRREVELAERIAAHDLKKAAGPLAD